MGERSGIESSNLLAITTNKRIAVKRIQARCLRPNRTNGTNHLATAIVDFVWGYVKSCGYNPCGLNPNVRVKWFDHHVRCILRSLGLAKTWSYKYCAPRVSQLKARHTVLRFHTSVIVNWVKYFSWPFIYAH